MNERERWFHNACKHLDVNVTRIGATCAKNTEEYLPLPRVCDWQDCTQQAIMKRWFREAGTREYYLCGQHAEWLSSLLHQARQYETRNNTQSEEEQ
jgi:hypothetical protein